MLYGRRFNSSLSFSLLVPSYSLLKAQRLFTVVHYAEGAIVILCFMLLRLFIFQQTFTFCLNLCHLIIGHNDNRKYYFDGYFVRSIHKHNPIQSCKPRTAFFSLCYFVRRLYMIFFFSLFPQFIEMLCCDGYEIWIRLMRRKKKVYRFNQAFSLFGRMLNHNIKTLVFTFCSSRVMLV